MIPAEILAATTDKARIKAVKASGIDECLAATQISGLSKTAMEAVYKRIRVLNRHKTMVKTERGLNHIDAGK